MKARPFTAALAGSALVFVLAVAIPLGAWSAVRAERLADRMILGISPVFQSAPNFWVALLLLTVVAEGTGSFRRWAMSGRCRWYCRRCRCR